MPVCRRAPIRRRNSLTLYAVAAPEASAAAAYIDTYIERYDPHQDVIVEAIWPRSTGFLVTKAKIHRFFIQARAKIHRFSSHRLASISERQRAKVHRFSSQTVGLP